MREFDALCDIREEARAGLVAGVRADLYNTSAKCFERHMDPVDFMPGAEDMLEARVAELIAGGMNPAAAVAVATSKQTKEGQIHVISRLKGPKPTGGRGRAQRAAKRV